MKIYSTARMSSWTRCTARFLAGLCLALFLNACATTGSTPDIPVLIHHGPVAEVSDVDVLEVSDAMAAHLERYVLPYGDLDTRLDLLTRSIVASPVFTFDYGDSRTLTAPQAYDARAGNCIAFSNLVVAMARESGLQAQYQEVLLEPIWTSEKETLLVAKHVNVIVRGKRAAYVVDSGGARKRENAPRKPLNDEQALALYYNNLGAEALLSSDLSLAYAWLNKAIETSPDVADAWVNLGVVFSWNAQWDAASLAYRHALDIDGGQYAALSNLYEAYVAMGDEEQAAVLEGRVERYRQRNPYHLLIMSEDAAEELNYEEAIGLLNRAIAKKEEEHMFHFALARTQYLAGDEQAAVASLQRARELAPADQLVEYNRPISELALED